MKKSFLKSGRVLPVSIDSSVKNFTSDIFHKENIFGIFIPAIKMSRVMILFCLFDLILYTPVNNFSFMLIQVFLS